MKRTKVVIIGAGISGLTLAANLKEDYLILEKENSIGGLCRTFYQDGFVWDYAGHFFHFATEEIKDFFENEVGDEDMVQCFKHTNIEYFGKVIEYPFQMNIHQLPQEEFIDCLYDLFNRNEEKNYDSFEKMLYGKFGKSITEKFLKPYNEKLYACNLNDLDTDAMGRFFPYANPKEIINNMRNKNVNTYNSIFNYPKLGAQFFVDLIANKVNPSRLMLNSTVEEVDPVKKMVVVNGEEIFYEKLVSTMPLNQFVKIVPQSYAGDISKVLTCNKVLVFNLGFEGSAIDKNVHWTYFPDKEINFYRVGYYSNILNSERLSMYIEIGFKENEVIDIEEQLNITLSNLKKCKIINQQKLISYNSLIINPGYVHITKKAQDFISNFEKEMQIDDIYTIGRYGKWTYCSIEDCMIDAISLARLIS